MNKLRRIFNPTREEQEEDRQKYKALYYELAEKKGCSTCKHCIHVRNYPGFVTAEECECSAGLECDTVLFSVENCTEWVDGYDELRLDTHVGEGE